MAITLNAKGTSVPYFKIGKSGVTLYQGNTDPIDDGYTIRTNDIWFDTFARNLKFRQSNSTWSEMSQVDNMSELHDVDLTGLADGYVLRYSSTSGNWEPFEVTGGLASDWGSIASAPIAYSGYTGDVWQIETQTNTLSHQGHVSIGGNLTVEGNLIFGNQSTDTIAFSADINSNFIPDSNATYNLGSSTQQWNNAFFSGTIDNSANTGAMMFPIGTTAQRPEVAHAGMVRFNSENTRFEGHNGTSWINIDIPDDWGSIS